MNHILKQISTVLVFTKLNTRRFFRDKLAIFFAILFPLIFLFVFGALSNNSQPSFKIAIIDNAKGRESRQFIKQIYKNKLFKLDTSTHGLKAAKAMMTQGTLNGVIMLSNTTKSNHQPSRLIVKVIYSHNNYIAGQTIISILQPLASRMNDHYIPITSKTSRISVISQPIKKSSLTAFDYVFSGLLGFSIVGMGIFGPINVFPELKKQGILRRLHITPLKVWQYFLSTMLSQALVGIVAIAIQFLAAIAIFHLKVDGNYFYIAIFSVISIFLILGIGLSIGGWAKNERQAAPLGNIIAMPLLFLSGSFFPRFDMPHWLQTITAYLPLTPVIDGLRLLTTEGKSLFQVTHQLALIGVWMIIIYFIAFRIFRWE